MTATELVTAMYNIHLGREPEKEGLNYWVGKISNGHRPLEIANAISQSEEALAYNK